MSKTISIAASTTWGPERRHLAAVLAALVGIVWALSFAGTAQARVILDDTSVREARSYDLSSLQESIRGQESMLPQETALREAARENGEQPVAGTEIEAVRAENFKFDAPYDGHHAATLRALNDPSYGQPQPEIDFTPAETQVAEIDDGVNVGVVTATMVGLLGVALLAWGLRHRRGVSPA